MTNPSEHIPTPGDIVRLKEPYKTDEWIRLKPKNWEGFGFGIIVEITATQFTVNGNSYGNQGFPRTVSLHLYDATGQLFFEPSYIKAGLMVPQYVDFHISELLLYRIASADGYFTVSDPLDWKKIWEDEWSVLQEFGAE